MSLIKSNTAGLGGSGSPGGSLGSFFSQTIDQSLRLDSASGAYLEIAEASPTATNRKKVTISCWVKRAGISVSGVNTVFWASTAGLMLQFFTADNIYIYDNNAGGWQSTVTNGGRLFRDPAAWYHLALIIDTTQSTSTDRAKFYINGELQTLNSYPGENTDITWHTGSTMRIGSVGDTQDLAGYIAEFISIDGQDTSISDFGETKDGVWIPKDVSGLTLGNAGFYLPFTQDRTVGASTFFSDSGNSYVEFSNASHYDIGGSDDFTIEFFMWPTVAGAADYSYIFGNYQGTSGPYLSVQYSNSGNAFYFYYGNGQAYSFTFSSGDVDAGRWHHVAINRASGNLDAFLDGTRLGGNQSSNSTSWDNNSVRIAMAQSNGTNVFDGYLSNVRMVVGSAVYSSGSSITVPTSTLTAVTNTQLLALTTTTITADASSNSVTGTVSGSGYFATDGLSPFANGAFNEDAGSNGIDFAAKNVFDYDVVPDSPTNNFATMNPLFVGTSVTYARGNLKLGPFGSLNSSTYAAISTFDIPKDKKIYVEVECTDDLGNAWTAGFVTKTSLENGPGGTNIGSSGSVLVYNRQVYVNGSETDYGASYGLGGLGSGVTKLAAGDILGCMIDGATGKVWFSRNGTYFMSPSSDNSGTTGDPNGGNHEIGTITGGTTDDVFFVVCGSSTTDDLFINFGQDSTNVSSANADSEGIGTFEYAPPTGYVALCASNLTTPAIGPTQSTQADDNFNIVLYTGNAGTLNVTGVGFQPDWVWIKSRAATRHHMLYDSVRGATKAIRSSLTNAEVTGATTLTSFDSDGFSLGADSDVNTAESLVSWNWKAGGAPTADNSAGNGATPTAGSVKIDGSNLGSALAGSLAATRLSANTTAGFSIVIYDASGVSSGTMAHGLTAAPDLIIAKNRNHGTNWFVQVPDILANTHILNLETTAAAFNPGINHFDDTVPTATVFSFGGYLGGHSDVGSNTQMIAYCFHNVEGYSKVGSYVGNNSTDGTFVFTGFRPAWVMIKCSSSSQGGNANWRMQDSQRLGYNPEGKELYADLANAEASNNFDILSNGFKIRNNSTGYNGSGATYIYLAFAEAPFKFANSR